MQIKFAFDRTSLKKIGKGALIAIGSALVTYLASNVDGIAAAFKDSPVLAALVTAFAGIAINAAKEWLSGVDQKTLTEKNDQVVVKVQDLVDDVKIQAVDEVKKESEAQK